MGIKQEFFKTGIRGILVLLMYLKVFGTKVLRFEATIGRNIVSATQYNDYITLLLTYNARVKIKSLENGRIVKLEKFLI